MSLKSWQTKRYGSGSLTTRHMDDESFSGSWVELAPPSRGSLSSSVDCSLLVEAQQTITTASNSAKGSHHSPKSLQSPNVELSQSLEAVKYRLLKDMVPPGRNTDWIWEWSSRPEAIPPKKYRPTAACSSWSAQTTPPNSPAPSEEYRYPWSFRHSKIMRCDFFRVEVLFGIMVTNIVTFIVGACIGFCICKRMYEKPAE